MEENTPRLPLLSEEESVLIGKENGMPAYMSKLNVFRTLNHQPRVAKCVNDMLMSILSSSNLDMRLRELIIMRLGWQTKSNYEWTQHWQVALRLGVPADVVLCMRLPLRDIEKHPLMTDADKAVVNAVDDVLLRGVISDATWQRCLQHVQNSSGSQAAALVEMTVAIGLWRLISSTARSLQFPVEDDKKNWPPDGVKPAHPYSRL